MGDSIYPPPSSFGQPSKCISFRLCQQTRHAWSTVSFVTHARRHLPNSPDFLLGLGILLVALQKVLRGAQRTAVHPDLCRLPVFVVLHLSNYVELARVGVEPADRRAASGPLRGDDLVVDDIRRVCQYDVPQACRREHKSLPPRAGSGRSLVGGC